MELDIKKNIIVMTAINTGSDSVTINKNENTPIIILNIHFNFLKALSYKNPFAGTFKADIVITIERTVVNKNILWINVRFPICPNLKNSGCIKIVMDIKNSIMEVCIVSLFLYFSLFPHKTPIKIERGFNINPKTDGYPEITDNPKNNIKNAIKLLFLYFFNIWLIKLFFNKKFVIDELNKNIIKAIIKGINVIEFLIVS